MRYMRIIQISTVVAHPSLFKELRVRTLNHKKFENWHIFHDDFTKPGSSETQKPTKLASFDRFDVSFDISLTDAYFCNRIGDN